MTREDEDKTFQEAVSDFANDTAFHGVRYIGHAPTIIGRCVWLLLFLGMTGAFIYQVNDRVNYYFSWPVTVDITVDDNRGQIPFPAVTICNTNTFRLSDVYEDGIYEDIVRFYQEKERRSRFQQNGRLTSAPTTTPRPASTSQASNPKTTGSTEKSTTTAKMSPVTQMTSRKNISFFEYDMRELLMTYGPRLNDTIKSVEFQSQKLSIENLTTVLTDYGRCVAFNHGTLNKLYSQGTGKAFGLDLLINLERYQNMEGEHTSSGLKVLVHSQFEAIRIRDLALSIPPSMTAVIDIRAKVTTELEEPYGKCIKGARTQSMCQHHCYIRITSSICQCLPYYAENRNLTSLPYCTLPQYKMCYKKQLAKIRQNPIYCSTDECPPPCKQLTYDSRISYTSLSKNMARTMSLKEKNDANMLNDYKKARETKHNTDRTIAATDYMKIKQFTDSIETLQIVMKKLRKFYKFKDRQVEDYMIKVYGITNGYRHFQDRMKFNYLSRTKIDRMDTVVIPGLISFETAILNAYPTHVQIIDDILSSGGYLSSFTSRKALFDINTIFENILNVIRTAKTLFKDVDTNLKAEIEKEQVDPNYPTPSSIYYSEVASIKERKIKFIDACETFMTTCKSSMKMLDTFGDSKKQTDWDSFKATTEDAFLQLNTKTQETAEKLSEQLKSVPTQIEQSKTLVLSQANALDAALAKYLVPIRQNNPYNDEQLTLFTVDVMDERLSEITTKYIDVLKASTSKTHTSVTRVASVLNRRTLNVLSNFTRDLAEFEVESVVSTVATLKDLGENIAQAREFFKKISPKHMMESIVHKNFSILEEAFSDLLSDRKDFVKYAEELKPARLDVRTKFDELNSYITKYEKSVTIDQNFLADNYVYVNVFFRTLTLETLDKSKAYLWFSLICDIGGSAGLYLGGSLLAIAEVFWFFGLQFVHSIKRMTKKVQPPKEHVHGSGITYVTESKFEYV